MINLATLFFATKHYFALHSSFVHISAFFIIHMFFVYCHASFSPALGSPLLAFLINQGFWTSSHQCFSLNCCSALKWRLTWLCNLSNSPCISCSEDHTWQGSSALLYPACSSLSAVGPCFCSHGGCTPWIHCSIIQKCLNSRCNSITSITKGGEKGGKKKKKRGEKIIWSQNLHQRM